MISVLNESRTILRACSSEGTCPSAIACTRTLPAAVASVGPISTGIWSALAVKWFSKLFLVPPPTMCRRSIFRPVIFSMSRNVLR